MRVDGRLWGAVMAATTRRRADHARGRAPTDRLRRAARPGDRQRARGRDRRRAEREAERQKDEFFTLVSHELRTPLASIKGYLEVLREEEEGEPLEPGERREFLAILERNAGRLERLVGDLLFVASIDEGRLPLDRSPVDLARVARGSVELATPAAEGRGIRLALQAEPVGPVIGDAGRLGQALDNLVSNAIKFTPDGGRVDVRLAGRDGRAVIEVADTGVGIPAGEQRQLFERFFRASSATERLVQGVGLGLTVVKAIVGRPRRDRRRPERPGQRRDLPDRAADRRRIIRVERGGRDPQNGTAVPRGETLAPHG